MKNFVIIFISILFLISCQKEAVNYPDVNVKELVASIKWDGSAEEINNLFEDGYKLSYNENQLNGRGDAKAFEYTGGKFLGEPADTWVVGFLNGEPNAVIVKYTKNNNKNEFFERICDKLEKELGASKMTLEKSRFWVYAPVDTLAFSVVCNAAPNTNDILVVIKKIR